VETKIRREKRAMQSQKVVVSWCDSPNSFRMRVIGQKRMPTRRLIIYCTLGVLGALLVGLGVGPSMLRLTMACAGIGIILIATRFVGEGQ